MIVIKQFKIGDKLDEKIQKKLQSLTKKYSDRVDWDIKGLWVIAPDTIVVEFAGFEF